MVGDSGFAKSRLELFFDDDCLLTEEKMFLSVPGTCRLGFDETGNGAGYVQNGVDSTWVDDWAHLIVYRGAAASCNLS